MWLVCGYQVAPFPPWLPLSIFWTVAACSPVSCPSPQPDINLTEILVIVIPIELNPSPWDRALVARARPYFNRRHHRLRPVAPAENPLQ